MKKLNLALGLLIVSSLLLFSATCSYAANSSSVSGEMVVDVPAVVLPVLAVDGIATITPTLSDFPTSRANTAIANVTNRNTITLGTGAINTSTSYVITNDTTYASGICYSLTANSGDAGTTTGITIPSGEGAKATLTLADTVGGGSVKLFITDYTTKGDAPTLGTKEFSKLVGGALQVPTDSAVAFADNSASAKEADLDMALDLDENSIQYNVALKHTYHFTLTLTAVQP
jgi:hypothetical protein